MASEDSNAAEGVEEEANAKGAEGAVKEVVLLHFNDVYNIEERQRPPVGGAARFASVLKSYKDARVVFSGDAFNPSMLSTAFKGAQMVPVLNELEVQVAVLGNHDFDFGVEQLLKLKSQTNFDWLISNVTRKIDGKPVAGGVVSKLVEWEGIKIGFIGLVEQEWLETLSTVNEKELDYEDFVTAAKRLEPQLRSQGAQVVIALTHMRVPNDKRLVKECPTLDLVLGGHDHDYAVFETKPLLVKSGTDFRQLTEIRLKVVGEEVKVSTKRIDIDESVEPDPAMEKVVADFTGALQSKLETKIGTTLVELDSRFASIRKGETNLGNFVCDVMRNQTNAEIALLNSGTLRADALTPAGELTLHFLFALLPMADCLVTLELTFDQLVSALENGVSQYPKLEGRFPQVSGVKFTFDPSKPPMSRIVRSSVEVLVSNVDDAEYVPMDQEKTYKVVTKKYLADGKDGYTSLMEAKVLVDDEESPRLPTLLRNHFSMLSVLNGFAKAKHFHECNLQRAKNKILERLNSRKKRKLDRPTTGGHDLEEDSKTDVLTSTCKGSVLAHCNAEKGKEVYTINPRVEGRIKVVT